MIVVAATRILDESDIVESFVRHTSAYVDHHIFIDNGSTDGTLDILARLKEEGFGLTVFTNRSVSFNEVNFNTRLFVEAVQVQAADWVLCLDCDEFIHDRGVEGGLRAVLEATLANPAILALSVPLAHYQITPENDPHQTIPALRMRHRGPVTDIHKVFLKGTLAGPDFQVGAGGHHAYLQGAEVASSVVPGLHLAHYSLRSTIQYAAKCTKGWAKVLAAGEAVATSGTSYHYKGVFETIRHHPHAMLSRSASVFGLVDAGDCILDPLDYKGGDLKYERPIDDLWRCLSSMVGYLEDLALRHGRLLTECEEARRKTAEWNTELNRVP